MMNKPVGLALIEVFCFHSSLSFMQAVKAAIKNKNVIQKYILLRINYILNINCTR